MRSRTNLWLLLVLAICATSCWWAFRRGEGQLDFLSAWRSTNSAAVSGEALDVEGRAGGDRAGEGRVEADEAIHVVVLNGSGVTGLARDVSLQLAMIGYVVEGVGNAPHQHFERTLLVNRRLDRHRAAALATRLGQVPVLREWDARSTEDAVIVLGADHEAVLKRLRSDHQN